MRLRSSPRTTTSTPETTANRSARLQSYAQLYRAPASPATARSGLPLRPFALKESYSPQPVMVRRAAGSNSCSADAAGPRPGTPVMSAMGLNRLEPTSRPGAAGRNVGTLNGNFAVLEGKMLSISETVDKLKVDTTTLGFGLHAKCDAMTAEIRNGFASLQASAPKSSAAGTVPKAPAAPTVVEISDDDEPRALDKASTAARIAKEKNATSAAYQVCDAALPFGVPDSGCA